MPERGEIEVRPEPADDTRDAIRAALAARAAERAAADGDAWWRAGVEESVRDELGRE